MAKGPHKTQKTKRRRTHGFLKRMKSVSGSKIVQRRRAKGRSRIAV